MNDTLESPTQVAPRDWLVLIHQLPPEPAYFRVKVRRRLQRLGAVALKNSVYLLPRRDETLEDFQWLLREIRADGGEATLGEASWLEGVTDPELVALFRSDREADYAELEKLAWALSEERTMPDEADLARLHKRLNEITGIDYFAAPGRPSAERAIQAAESRLAIATDGPAAAPGPAQGATWVTRQGVFVDRIASGWLIRRFIDPKARFKFVPAKGYRPAAGEQRFDMFQGEYTHEGDRCTFEVLLDRFGLADPALRAIGEIVHDIDCKDDKFGRAETAGIAAILNGIVLECREDQERMEQGVVIFEGLFTQFRSGVHRKER
jgi:hypothetical protein